MLTMLILHDNILPHLVIHNHAYLFRLKLIFVGTTSINDFPLTQFRHCIVVVIKVESVVVRQNITTLWIWIITRLGH